jgi:hypothetical protein
MPISRPERDTRHMKTCLTCGTASPESATFCSGCASTLNRGLPWYVAIPVSLGAGFALFAFDVLGEYAVYAHPDIRSQISTTIFLAVVVSVAVLWFSWLRFSVKRWRIRRAYLQGHEFSPGVPWYIAIPASLGIGVAVFFTMGGVSLWDGVFWAVVVCVAVLWFSWLRFSVKRRRLRRAVDGREP